MADTFRLTPLIRDFDPQSPGGPILRLINVVGGPGTDLEKFLKLHPGRHRIEFKLSDGRIIGVETRIVASRYREWETSPGGLLDGYLDIRLSHLDGGTIGELFVRYGDVSEIGFEPLAT